jgi:hypothetical protein
MLQPITNLYDKRKTKKKKKKKKKTHINKTKFIVPSYSYHLAPVEKMIIFVLG